MGTTQVGKYELLYGVFAAFLVHYDGELTKDHITA